MHSECKEEKTFCLFKLFATEAQREEFLAKPLSHYVVTQRSKIELKEFWKILDAENNYKSKDKLTLVKPLATLRVCVNLKLLKYFPLH